MIHCKSRRGNRPLVIHSAKSLDGEALARAITEARGSTLLIEDIEHLPQASQQALVRNLKERASTPPSDTPPARIIATTTAHLPEMVARGSFREDLYYRLHMFPIVMPSLRERLDDIPVLVESLIAQCGSTNAIQRTANITSAAMSTLTSMNWPGNVAQLESVIRRAFFTAGGHPIDREHIQVSIEAATKPVVTTSHGAATTTESEDEITESSIVPFEKEEQRLLSRALQATRGNVRRAAQLLGIGRATLYRKIQQYQLRLH
jgi:DNA-binding NtrC family response regulator